MSLDRMIDPVLRTTETKNKHIRKRIASLRLSPSKIHAWGNDRAHAQT